MRQLAQVERWHLAPSRPHPNSHLYEPERGFTVKSSLCQRVPTGRLILIPSGISLASVRPVVVVEDILAMPFSKCPVRTQICSTDLERNVFQRVFTKMRLQKTNKAIRLPAYRMPGSLAALQYCLLYCSRLAAICVWVGGGGGGGSQAIAIDKLAEEVREL